MELRHLRYFVAVAQELSFTRAARRLHMAQPPLSQQIRSLEEELGCRLFERAGRTVLLTEAGRELLPGALEVLGGAERLRERATQRARQGHATLRVALISSFATPRFAAMLREFQKRSPGVELSLGDHASAWQLEALGRGELDVGFLRPPRRLPANLSTHVLRREPMRLAVPSAHPLAKGGVTHWRALEGEPLILIETGASGDYYAGLYERCRSAGFEPTVRQHTLNVATQVWLVSAGLGLAPMPHTPDIDRHPGVAFVDLPRDAPRGETAVAWRSSDSSPATLRFVEVAREALTTG